MNLASLEKQSKPITLKLIKKTGIITFKPLIEVEKLLYVLLLHAL